MSPQTTSSGTGTLQPPAVEILENLPVADWTAPIPSAAASQAVAALEGGKILYAPGLHFELTDSERQFLSPSCLSGKSKNVSFENATGAIGGTSHQGASREALAAMMRRFFTQATALMRSLYRSSADRLAPGRTSFRPAEISGRVSSWRKDDSRLHFDAFPSRPIRGNRIVRVFANVNPTQPRIWRAGEPFGDAARKLLPRVRPPAPGSLALLSLLHVTKGRRSLYDHYMLGLHDAMKADTRYQAECPQATLSFVPGAVWICFTDSISHAAMSGQHAFEQTFYLPVTAMRDPACSPLRILEGLLAKPLL